MLLQHALDIANRLGKPRHPPGMQHGRRQQNRRPQVVRPLQHRKGAGLDILEIRVLGRQNLCPGLLFLAGLCCNLQLHEVKVIVQIFAARFLASASRQKRVQIHSVLPRPVNPSLQIFFPAPKEPPGQRGAGSSARANNLHNATSLGRSMTTVLPLVSMISCS